MSNAFTNPSNAKILQQQKILEELQRQKNLLNKGTIPSSTNAMSSTTTTQAPAVPSIASTSSSTESHLLSSNQRAALENATKTSFGYFISQDSSFGNLILPVIPRINKEE